MKITFRLTNRAILRSGLDMQGNRWTIRCEASDLPPDVRRPLADRLSEDTFVCAGRENERGGVEPKCTEDGFPDLLCVDGTDLQSLIEAVRRDQQEVEAEEANLSVAAED